MSIDTRHQKIRALYCRNLLEFAILTVTNAAAGCKITDLGRVELLRGAGLKLFIIDLRVASTTLIAKLKANDR